MSDYLTQEELVQVAIAQLNRSGLSLEQGVEWLSLKLQELGIEGRIPPSDAEVLRDLLALRLLRTQEPPASLH